MSWQVFSNKIKLDKQKLFFSYIFVFYEQFFTKYEVSDIAFIFMLKYILCRYSVIIKQNKINFFFFKNPPLHTKLLKPI